MDFDTEGGGPTGVVDGMGSRRSLRSGVEGGSEDSGMVNFMAIERR
jgi:hypothetical protein